MRRPPRRALAASTAQRRRRLCVCCCALALSLCVVSFLAHFAASPLSASRIRASLETTSPTSAADVIEAVSAPTHSSQQQQRGRTLGLPAMAVPALTPSHHFVRTPAGVDMPRLIYGTAWKKDLTAQHVLTALRLGFKGIDTACQPKHYREDLVGAAVRQALEEKVLEDRSQVFLQTKFTSLDGQDPKRVPYDPGAPLVDQVKQSFAKSLENLGTEYLDSVVLHSPLRTYEQTLTAWRVLEEFHAQGKVRQLGVSNTYDVSLLQRLFEDAAVKPAVVQNRFYQQSGYDRRLRAFCREKGIVYQSFWTLTANPHLLQSQPIRGFASRLQCTPQQAFFRFVMQLGIAPLTGTTNPEHMKQDLAALDLPDLTQEEFQAVAELIGGS